MFRADSEEPQQAGVLERSWDQAITQHTTAMSLNNEGFPSCGQAYKIK